MSVCMKCLIHFVLSQVKDLVTSHSLLPWSVAVASIAIWSLIFRSRSTPKKVWWPSPEAVSPSNTIVSLLHKHAIPRDVLDQRYGSLLLLVRTLIGVVPNCDAYLEIWPTGFRSYNIMVPNLLNLPFSVFGISPVPASLVGLGMYVASRVAGCSYCSAHTCSFALRRGGSPETLARALFPVSPSPSASFSSSSLQHSFSRQELAVIAVARSLASIPCQLTPGEKQEFLSCFKPAQAEWIVLGTVMMGWLNKCMDALSVELETDTAAEVADIITSSGWRAGKNGQLLQAAALSPRTHPKKDSIWTKACVLPLAPNALRLDALWTKGVPGAWPAVGEYLREHVGYSFAVLSHLSQERAIRAIATMIRDNCDASVSVLGLPVKVLAAVVFAEVTKSDPIYTIARALAAKQGVSDTHTAEVARFVREKQNTPSFSVSSSSSSASSSFDPTRQETIAALLLARAASPSPADISEAVVSACKCLKPAAIVEMVAWLSLLQMLHRLASFYGADERK